jgi:hypothetical protein
MTPRHMRADNIMKLITVTIFLLDSLVANLTAATPRHIKLITQLEGSITKSKGYVQDWILKVDFPPHSQVPPPVENLRYLTFLSTRGKIMTFILKT